MTNQNSNIGDAQPVCPAPQPRASHSPSVPPIIPEDARPPQFAPRPPNMAQWPVAPVSPSPTPAMTTPQAPLAPTPPSPTAPAQPTSPQSPIPRILSLAEFIAEANAERKGWFWDGLLPRSGVAIVGGSHLTGKSVLMTVLCAAASSDTEEDAQVAGRYVEESRVLYCDLEHTKSPLVDHLLKASTAYNATDLRSTSSRNCRWMMKTSSRLSTSKQSGAALTSSSSTVCGARPWQ